MSNHEILGERQFEVVRSLQMFGFEDAMIAGGAARDLYFKKPFNDVDIFTCRDSWSHEHSLQCLLEVVLPRCSWFNREVDFIERPAESLGTQDTILDRQHRQMRRVGLARVRTTAQREEEEQQLRNAVVNNPDTFFTTSTNVIYSFSPDGAPLAGQILASPQRAPDRGTTVILDEGGDLTNPYSDADVDVLANLFIGGVKYQFLAIPYPLHSFFPMFDFDLNKIYHDGERLQPSPEFLKDAAAKTYTVSKSKHSNYNFKRIVGKRWPQLQQKYPDFSLNIIP